MATEGRLEVLALQQLNQHGRNHRVSLHPIAECGDPEAVVSAADQWFDNPQRNRRGVRRGDAEVWVVFDRDDHAHWKTAIDRARSLGFHVAASNPCFELWALLLIEDCRAHVERHTVRRRLRERMPGYSHKKPPRLPLASLPDLDERLAAADERAEALLGTAGPGEALPNPSTTFHHLARRLLGRA